MNEITVDSAGLEAAVTTAARSTSPYVVKLGRNDPLRDAFGRHALEKFANVGVVAEKGDPSRLQGDWSGTLGTLLDVMHLRSAHPLYMKHVTLADISPDLVSEVPGVLRRLNWMAALPADMRPNWYWLMIGQEGSSTPRHVDTMASAAWNYLVEGTKVWKFAPPLHALREGRIPIMPAPSDDSKDYEFEYTQQPGDLLFTPSAWVHAVHNETATIAVTGNYLGESNIMFAARYFDATNENANAALCRDVARGFGVTEY
ncbi:hypothetical protein [Microbacterium sp. SORGH_AS_0421]|uniref:hypothetical protein n=1 Tax=Microbacterium sp. SORGH_AS_0421 TaxID=3041768 RepID=UPI00278CBA5C|nr:hypothetical protein [Microbacterium sp. SORGH_AS_0421]MDQ1177769.1 histone arginine demethylase JMJD6 [Microbacterium sp. SORGH_AS_0421]